MSQATSQSWEYFKAAIRTDFIRFDYVRRTIDKLPKLVQHSIVAKYLNEVWNLALTIPDMSDGEKLDNFWAGLKPQGRL